MSEIDRKAARRGQPGSGYEHDQQSTGKIYHIVKRAATTADSDRAPDRVLSPFAPEKSSEAAGPHTLSHTEIPSASLCMGGTIAEKQLAAFQAFIREASDADRVGREQLLSALTAGPSRRDMLKAKARESYRANAKLRDLSGSEFVKQQELCARLWAEYDALLHAADGGGEGLT